MPILQDIPIALAAEELLSAQGHGRVRPELVQDAERSIALGQVLWQPKAVYDWFEVRAVAGEQVHLLRPTEADREAALHVGPKAALLSGAQQVLVGVGTIGPLLGDKVQELHRAGDGLLSYLLDSAGVLALGAVGAALRCLAEEAAAAHGWGVSAALSPGSLVGWELRGQRELCALVSLDEIGVRLNEYCVLEPHKSFSTVVGLGPGYTATRVGSVCKYCALRHTCWRRREDRS